jgi:methylated-DNA-protein-cysteine methyltransferase-like protein
MGELMVDLKEFGWFPRILPSEEAEGLTPHIDDDGDEEEAQA